MANVVESILSEELIKALREGRLVTIATIDFESQSPNVHVISWVYAMDESKIRFVADLRSRIVSNIRQHNGLVMTVMTNESVYSIYGNARILKEQMENVPLKLTLMEMDINMVRDVMFYGSRISQEPTYEKTYDINAAKKLDTQVLKAMIEA
ncbi:MAG: pyridoxamine 5'-phosphate oxidase family protein [Bacillaceae bacterium]